MSGICLPIDAQSGAPAFPASQNRVAFGALMLGRTDRPLGAVSGVRPGSEPTVTVTATQWTVTPFVATVDPETALTVGAYLVGFLADETGTINAADSTYARIDRLDVQVPDDPAGASPLDAQIVYTEGVASSSPAVPDAPGRSIPLGQISVPKAGQGSPSFASTLQRTVANGGILPVPDSGYYPANPYVGQYVDDAQLGLVRYSGAAGWVKVDDRRKVLFKGSIATTTAVPNATNLPFAALEDPFSGWDNSAHQWKVPQPGLYRVEVCLKWNGTGAGANTNIHITQNGATAFQSPNAAGNSTGFGGMDSRDFLRCALNDNLAIQCNGTAFTTQTDAPADNNILLIERISD